MVDLSTGLSGCKISLIEDGIIRKVSSSPEYNPRLQKQINKQTLFSNLTFRHLAAPHITDEGSENGLLTFDMAYCSGKSYHEYLSLASPKQVDEVIAALVEYFDSLVSNCKYYSQSAACELINNKLNQLSAKSRHLDLISNLIRDSRTANGPLPHTFCHGDLTLSNIIFHPKKLFFIDFLDSFVDSYLIDLVKLKQDLVQNWSATVQGKDSLRLAQARAEIWKNLEQRYCPAIDSDYFRILEVINFLRIEPYLRDSRQIEFLSSILNIF